MSVSTCRRENIAGRDFFLATEERSNPTFPPLSYAPMDGSFSSRALEVVPFLLCKGRQTKLVVFAASGYWGWLSGLGLVLASEQKADQLLPEELA